MNLYLRVFIRVNHLLLGMLEGWISETVGLIAIFLKFPVYLTIIVSGCRSWNSMTSCSYELR